MADGTRCSALNSSSDFLYGSYLAFDGLDNGIDGHCNLVVGDTELDDVTLDGSIRKDDGDCRFFSNAAITADTNLGLGFQTWGLESSGK